MIIYITLIFFLIILFKIFASIILESLIRQAQNIVIDDDFSFNLISDKILDSDKGIGIFENIFGLRINGKTDTLYKVYFNNSLDPIKDFKFNKIFLYDYALINIEIDIHNKKIIIYMLNFKNVQINDFISNFLKNKLEVDFNTLRYIHRYAFIAPDSWHFNHNINMDYDNENSLLQYGNKVGIENYHGDDFRIFNNLDRNDVIKYIKEWNYISDMNDLMKIYEPCCRVRDNKTTIYFDNCDNPEYLYQQCIFSKYFNNNTYNFNEISGLDYCHYCFVDDNILYSVIIFDKKIFIFMLTIQKLDKNYCINKIGEFIDHFTQNNSRHNRFTLFHYSYNLVYQTIWGQSIWSSKMFISNIQKDKLLTDMLLIDFTNFCGETTNKYISIYGEDYMNKINLVYKISKISKRIVYSINIKSLKKNKINSNILKFVKKMVSNKTFHFSPIDRKLDKHIILIENIDSIKNKSTYLKLINIIESYIKNIIVIFTSKNQNKIIKNKIDYSYNLTFCDKGQIIKITKYAIKKYVKFAGSKFLHIPVYDENTLPNDIENFANNIINKNIKILPIELFKYILKNIILEKSLKKLFSNFESFL